MTPAQTKAVGVAIVAALKRTMAAGQLPDESPAPPVSPATARRRELRREQAARGGGGAPRYTAEVQGEIRRNWDRHDRDPGRGQVSSTVGYDTGAMAESLHLATGGVWCTVRRDGQLDALRRKGMFDAEKVLAHPSVRKTLRSVTLQMLRDFVGAR